MTEAFQGMTDGEKAIQVCILIAEGSTVRKAAAKTGLEQAKFFRLVSANTPDGQALMKHYMRAREARADSRFESMDDLMVLVRAGKVDAQQARVLMDAIKWQTGRESGKYRESLDLTSGGKPLAPTTIVREIVHKQA